MSSPARDGAMFPTVVITPFADPRRRAERLVWLVLGGAALLLLAAWSPADRPGPVLCTLRLAVGLPCPFCGVTRGVGLCLRGRVAEAVALNPLTLAVALGGAGLMATWAYEWVTGRQVRLRWPRRAGWLLVPALVAVLGAWAYQVGWRREDDFAASWLGRLLGLW